MHAGADLGGGGGGGGVSRVLPPPPSKTYVIKNSRLLTCAIRVKPSSQYDARARDASR